MPELTIIQCFNMARTANNESAQEVADRIKTTEGTGVSRGYLYECLKYPDKNPDIHRQGIEYIKSAGIPLPKSKLASANP